MTVQTRDRKTGFVLSTPVSELPGVILDRAVIVSGRRKEYIISLDRSSPIKDAHSLILSPSVAGMDWDGAITSFLGACNANEMGRAEETLFRLIELAQTDRSLSGLSHSVPLNGGMAELFYLLQVCEVLSS